MIDPIIALALQVEHTKERQNSQIYDCLTTSLTAVNFLGSAKWMHKAARDERHHAKWFADYLISRDEFPIFEALEPCVVLQSDDLVTYFQAAMDAEQSTTIAINKLYTLAVSNNDPQTVKFLHWFIQEQTNSERELFDILTTLRRFGGDPTGYQLFDDRLR